MSSRTTVLSLVSALAMGASLLGAAPAFADASGALYVTQRDPAASANVASFTIGAFDGSLSSPIFAGSGGAASFGIAVTPDGAHVYVTNDNGGSSISQYSVDPSTGALTPLTPATVATSGVGGAEPEDVAVDPSGRWVYVANPAAGSVSQLRIDPATGALTMVSEFQSELISFPTGVALSPDGHSLYVADFGAGNIVEFDVDANTGSLIPKSDAVAPLPKPFGGSMPEPRRLVTATVGGSDYLYVSDYANAQVDEFTIGSGTGELSAGAGVASDSNPTGLAVDTASTPASLYVAAEGVGAVDEYDIDSTSGTLAPKASPSIPAGSGPDGVAMAPDGQELYV
ncbi:MAG TPA: beta-propeller fold lactonase family protein, partial [Solirubrobacteraceae bacterium]|nr:beta-propeller fold lactonase family protein [Solirubrobacteraceae bacterium]